MWFNPGPELAFGDHRDCGEDDRAVLPTLEPKHLARVALAERDLAAFANDLDLDAITDHRCGLLHAIMLSCHHAARNGVWRRSRAQEVPFGDDSGSDLFEPSILQVVAARANRYHPDRAANLAFRFDPFEQRESDRAPFLFIA